MIQKDLLHLVEIVSVLADAPILEELLAAADLPSSSYSNFETGLASTCVLAENAAEAQVFLQQIESLLPEWAGLLSAPLQSLECRDMRQEDWSESWKKHFHTFRASERLLVKPSWEDAEAQPGDIILELDPGMCFGTGYHGTTKACLQFLDQLQQEIGPGASFLDAGCGSGILSIAARLLGYNPVFAFDHDPQAVDTAQENLNKAGFLEVQPVLADVKDYLPPQPCRLLAANILATVLMRHAEQILACLVKDDKPAFLILSGILNEQYAEVKECFSKLGCKEIKKLAIQEWSSGCFQINAV